MEAAPIDVLAVAVDGLLDADLSRVGSIDLIDLLRAIEVQVRRLAAVDHRLVAEIDARGVGHELGACSTMDLLRQALRITRREASARVHSAADLGPRRTLTGERLPPLFPAVAAAQTTGTISAAHARVVTSTVDDLPADLQSQHGAAVETFLVDHALRLDPAQLGHAATRLSDTLNPDGTATTAADHERHRDLTLHVRRDGCTDVTGRLTPSATAIWQTILDALSAPEPAADGARDPRTAGQRRHDALVDAGERLLRSGDIPDSGGVPATVIVTLTLDQLQTRTASATTVHGVDIPVADLLRRAAEAEVIPVVINSAGGVVAYGRTRRLASRAQRLALIARDRGCSFPDCTRPATWCQTHHVIAWADGGLTDLDYLTLVCGYHHRAFEKQGWMCLMIGGVPYWTPPRWLDETQTPRRNTAQHAGIELSFADGREAETSLAGAPP